MLAGLLQLPAEVVHEKAKQESQSIQACSTEPGNCNCSYRMCTFLQKAWCTVDRMLRFLMELHFLAPPPSHFASRISSKVHSL